MGAAGSPYAAFQRAMRAGNVTLAPAEARDLPKLNVAGSLALLLLIAEKDPRLYERAAVRWAGRFMLERQPTLADVELALAALGQREASSDGGSLGLRTLVQR